MSSLQVNRQRDWLQTPEARPDKTQSESCSHTVFIPAYLEERKVEEGWLDEGNGKLLLSHVAA